MVALILFLDIRLCNWIQDGRVIPWGMTTGRWTNRNGESLQSRCQERSCTADVSSSSKKGAMRVSWTQKEEQPVLCEVTNDWIRAQLVIFMRLPSLKTETGWGEGIEMRSENEMTWRRRSQQSLRSLVGVVLPWFPHPPTGLREQSWSQPATEIQNLACDLDAWEIPGNWFCK